MGKAAKRLAARRRREAARARRRRTLLVSGAAVVVIAVIVAVVVVIQRSRDDSGDTGRYSGPLAPITVDPSTATVTMTKPGVNEPRLDVYEDFQCPYCKQFEQSTGSVVRRLAAQGKVKVVYHLMTGVNPIGSPRAAAAALCVPGNRWMAYHDALYARQPAEAQDPRRSAFTVKTLRDIGADVGLDDKTLGCISDQKYAAAAQAASEKAVRDDHIQGTPTLRRDGKDIPFPSTVLNADKLEKAITG